MAWTDGYEASTTWVGGYQRWQAPNLLAYLAVQQGLLAPKWEGGFSYLELGCGSGLTSVVLAAANPQAEIHANDFDPGAIAIARTLAAAAGVKNATFHEKSFADYLTEERPDFDFVTGGLVYSWISDESRAHIVSILRDSLRSGGLCALSYLARPGSAAKDAVQALLYQHFHSSSGDPAQRARAAIEFATSLAREKVGFFGKFPEAARFVERIASMDGVSALHEFINANYRTLYRHEVIDQMAEAKLSPVGSAILGLNEPGLCLDEANLAAYRNTADHRLRSLVKDYALSSEANADVFCRGITRAADVGETSRFLDQRFALTLPKQSWAEAVQCGQKPFPLFQAYPVLEQLASPQSLGELLNTPKIAALGLEQLRLWLLLLIDSGHLQPALPAAAVESRLASCWRCNETFLRLDLPAFSTVTLASPVLGAGIQLDGYSALMARAHLQDGQDPAAAAALILRRQGQTPSDQLGALAEAFVEGWLPVLTMLRCLG